MKEQIKQLIELNKQLDDLRSGIENKLWSFERGQSKAIVYLSSDMRSISVGLTMKCETFCTVRIDLTRKIIWQSHELSNQEKHQFYKVFDEVMKL